MNVSNFTCLWPGLSRVWFRGSWRSLLVALGFTALVNLLLATTIIWPEVASPTLRAVAFVAAAFWWVVSLTMSLRELPEIVAVTDGDSRRDRHKGLFTRAQSEYLKGNWIETEAVLRKLCHRSRDCEAMLLLATLLRRTGRADEARHQLQHLARLEAAARWQLEIQRERELLRRQREKHEVEESVVSVKLESQTTSTDTTNQVSIHRKAA